MSRRSSKKISPDVPGGSHLKTAGEPYYEKNQTPLGKARARKTHKMGTEMFSQYDTSYIQPKKKGPGKGLIIVIVVVVVVVAAILIVAIASGESNSDVTAGVEVEVTIPEGSSASDIAAILCESGVVATERRFIKAVDAHDAADSLMPGTYTLTTLMDEDELIETLTEGVMYLGTKLIISEGLTVPEVAAAVEDQTGIDSDEFEELASSASSYADDYPFLADAYDDSLEGYLFPKTYDVQDDATADTVIRMMLDQFCVEVEDAGISYDGANGYTLAEIVTIASMIQEETPNTEEMPTVSSVIYNRLDQGMKLQFDSTVVYALGDSYSGEDLTYSDLEVDSPYNTYVTDALPAGPIDSPGIEALTAAVDPADTDYLYFLGFDDDTVHEFFEDYDAFVEAKNS